MVSICHVGAMSSARFDSVPGTTNGILTIPAGTSQVVGPLTGDNYSSMASSLSLFEKTAVDFITFDQSTSSITISPLASQCPKIYNYAIDSIDSAGEVIFTDAISVEVTGDACYCVSLSVTTPPLVASEYRYQVKPSAPSKD